MDYDETNEKDIELIELIRKDFPVTKKNLYELWIFCSNAVIHNKINY